MKTTRNLYESIAHSSMAYFLSVANNYDRPGDTDGVRLAEQWLQLISGESSAINAKRFFSQVDETIWKNGHAGNTGWDLLRRHVLEWLVFVLNSGPAHLARSDYRDLARSYLRHFTTGEFKPAHKRGRELCHRWIGLLDKPDESMSMNLLADVQQAETDKSMAWAGLKQIIAHWAKHLP